MKKKSISERFFSFLVKLFAFAIIVLVIAIAANSAINDYKLKKQEAAATPVPEETAESSELILYRPSPSATPDTTEGPAVTATPAPTPAPEAALDLLPIYDRGNTTVREIAITVNDLSQAASLQKMAEVANRYDAKLTLFPSLHALNDMYASMMISKCVTNYGYEIENAGSFTDYLYKMSDEEMAKAIWETDNAIDGVVGGNYQAHFYRPFGALGAEDERTHAYLRQLGYEGIVTWTVNGSASSMETLMESIAPGQIYLFESTVKDTDKLINFLHFANSKGYRVVTVNSLLDYEESEVTEHNASFLFATMVPLEPYEETPHTMHRGERSWTVYRLQKRLIELGYATEDLADGVYGGGTSSAVALFQTQAGEQGTGVCTPDLQKRILADDAPRFDGYESLLWTPEPTESTETSEEAE